MTGKMLGRKRQSESGREVERERERKKYREGEGVCLCEREGGSRERGVKATLKYVRRYPEDLGAILAIYSLYGLLS